MQNYEYTLDPGAREFETIGAADFIFVRYADREFDLVIDNETVTMEIGAEYTHDQGLFNRFEIHNPDPDNPVVIRLAIGTARYRSRIIQGEVSIVPGIRNASGVFVEDTRWTLAADVDITTLEPTVFSKNSQLEFVSTWDTVQKLALFYEDNLMLVSGVNGGKKIYDLDTEQVVQDVGSNTITIGAYSFIVFNGTLDKNGQTWVCGKRDSDNEIAAIRIDSSLNILEVRQGPSREDNFGNASATSSVAFDSNNTLYLMVPDQNLYGVIVRRWDESAGGFVTVGRIDKSAEFWVPRHLSIQQKDGKEYLVWSRAGSANAYGAFDLTADALTQISGSGFINYEYGGMEVPQKRLYWKCEATSNFKAFNNITWTRTAQGTFETCAGGYAFDLDTYDTEAAVTATQTDKGVKLDGQVIRALLELWLGQFVADDYLDHVYQVEFDNADGRAPVTISSGGTSFKGAKIADSFSCVFPQSVRITLDNNLTTKD